MGEIETQNKEEDWKKITKYDTRSRVGRIHILSLSGEET